MGSQHLRHLLHRFNPRAHGSFTPVIEKLDGPGRRDILPEELKILFEKISPDRLEIAAQEFTQFDLLAFREIRRSFQKTPTGSCQHRPFPFCLKLLDLRGAHFVDSLAHMAHDVEPIQNVDCLASLLGNDPNVRLPHIRTDKPEFSASLLAEPLKEAEQTLLRTFPSHPEQTLGARVDLVDQCNVLLAFPRNLVDADGTDPLR